MAQEIFEEVQSQQSQIRQSQNIEPNNQSELQLNQALGKSVGRLSHEVKHD